MLPLTPVDYPPVKYQELKEALNDQFHSTAKISGLVSYIYYPGVNLLWGHAKVEVDGTAHTLIFNSPAPLSIHYERSLSEMTRSATTFGFPFFRYEITVTPNDLKSIKENLGDTYHFTCAQGALSTLSRFAGYTVPFPLSISPLASAAFLYTAKKLGSHRIKKIEFLGSESRWKNTAMSITGIVGETCLMIGLIYLITCIFTRLLTHE